jgi:beta-galactosidase
MDRVSALVVTMLLCAGAAAAGAADPGEPRDVRMLDEGWRFVQDDALSAEAALRANGATWRAVRLPHTWNAEDAASLKAGDYKRGVGWYRLEFDSPKRGARHWLEFGAASLVADVWLNGEKLGQHKGGFTKFRFDVTERLKPAGANVLLVRVDSSEPQKEDDPTAIAPLGGDFNVSGGLYRRVALVSTADPVHIALGDMGSTGVYAATSSIANGDAVVRVRTKLEGDLKAGSRYAVRAALVDGDGRVAATAEQAASTREISQTLNLAKAHLWQGIDDPYLYQLVVEVLRDGTAIDRVTQRFGIREMRFDANEGFFLNGRNLRLRGVAMHQDFLGKAWAVSDEDLDESFALVREVGANAVRLGHYPFSDHALEKADALGLVAWAETALGLGTTVQKCSTYPASRAFVDNAKAQLSELIRQQYNHAAIATWSVGNETTARQNNCGDQPFDNVRPVLRELHAVAKAEDPGRPTVYAEFGYDMDKRKGVYATENITDLLAINRYYAWYTQPFTDFSPLLDAMHGRAYRQPLGVSEYGAGAAISHHTDNPLGGPPDVRSAPPGQTSYQPEEYAAYAHEENYRLLAGKPYLWGTFVWNMFDFGSAHRNEGDVLGVNTKGLVTFDRKTRKDPFFFYKANWSREPVTYIASRRHTERAQAIIDVKVYSNAEAVELAVDGVAVARKSAEECPLAVCVFKDVRLRDGENTVTATGRHGNRIVADTARWRLDAAGVDIAAGWVASGYVAANGQRFGSDDFFLGGEGRKVERQKQADMGPENLAGAGATRFAGTRDILLYQHFRAGTFAYQIPLENARYEVTLGFVEPQASVAPGARVFDVLANGKPALQRFDVAAAAGGSDDAVVTRRFPVEVTEGRLTLDFVPSLGEAVVSTISVRRAR